MRLILIILMICIILFLSACATTMPTRYGEAVYITDGVYKNERGTLIGDCPGFERYMVRILRNNKKLCVPVWNLEKVY